jgi:hypothetical protein
MPVIDGYSESGVHLVLFVLSDAWLENGVTLWGWLAGSRRRVWVLNGTLSMKFT